MHLIGRLTWGILFAAVMAISPAQAEKMRGGTADDYTAIQEQHLSLLGYYNEGDADGFVSSYTKDAWYVTMRRPVAVNEEGLRAFFGPGSTAYDFHADYELLDLEVMGDVAVMLGRSQLHGVPRGDAQVPPFTEDRIYTAVFKKVAGSWLIHRFMESTSPREGESHQDPMDFCKNLLEQGK